MKTAKLVKHALENPEKYREGELAYFVLWLKEHEARKKRKKQFRLFKPVRIKKSKYVVFHVIET
jgi:hypothetical protein